MHFGHVLTALVTPFDAKGNVNFPTLTELIERLIHHGTEGFVITGTTGESPVLSIEEMESIYKHVVSVVNRRVPVIAGTGTNNTNKTIQLTKIAEAQNVDGIMLVSPYYNRPNQRGLYEHFRTVAKETTLPIMLYNIPGRCGVLDRKSTRLNSSHVAHSFPTRRSSDLVIAGTGTNNTNKTIQLTKIAEAQNVDGIMLVSPYYNRPNQRGLYEHFRTVAKETTLPIMLYNLPGRCGVLIEAETIIELSKINNIIAVKEASGNLELATTVVANTPDDFYLYSGDDSMTLPMMAIGATGVVSVASHIIGLEMNEMVHSFLEGKTVEAASIHRNMLPIMKGLFMAPSPAPVKAAVRMQGIDVGSVRLPLVDLTEVEKVRLKKIMQEHMNIS